MVKLFVGKLFVVRLFVMIAKLNRKSQFTISRFREGKYNKQGEGQNIDRGLCKRAEIYKHLPPLFQDLRVSFLKSCPYPS